MQVAVCEFARDVAGLEGASSSEENLALSMTICKCLREVPSFNARNAMVLLSREVRTQPFTFTVSPTCFSPCCTISEMSMCSILSFLHGHAPVRDI